MSGGSQHRVVGRLLQALGIIVMSGSLLGMFPQVTARAEQAFALVAEISPVKLTTPAPAVTPGLTPKPIKSAVPVGGQGEDGGPAAAVPDPTPSGRPMKASRARLEFGLNGSLALGHQSSSSTFGTTTNTLGSTNQNIGMTAEVRRRSAFSSFDITLPVAFGNNSSYVGALQALYSTPTYSLGYGAQSLSVFGQLPVGGTLRGLIFAVPSGAGDITAFSGPTLGANGDQVRLSGVRMRRLVKSRLVELGVAHSTASSTTPAASTVLAGVVQTTGLGTLLGEFAGQERGGDDGGGIAGQLRYDYGRSNSLFSTTLRSVPQRFLLYGLGEVYGDKLIDVSMQKQSSNRSLSWDFALERQSLDQQLTNSRRSFLSFGGMLGKSSYSVSFQDQRLSGTSPALWTGSIGGQISIPLHNMGLLFSSTLQRQTQEDGPPSAISQFGTTMQRQFGLYTFVAADQEQRQTGYAVVHQGTRSAQVLRTFGKTTLGYQYSVNVVQSLQNDALSVANVINVARQISPAIQAQLNYGVQSLTDRLNPFSNGRSKIFSIQLNAPFTIGNAAVEGRADPRLPASILGRVITDAGGDALFASFATGGLANALVILDGKEVERTDLQGNFQFSFVQPGSHQVRIEAASLPRGLTADQPIISVNVQGGQQASVYFRVGNFGGVLGHVYGRDSSGVKIPLSNVLVRVDGGAYSQTDADGSFGFGRLQPGRHTVEIIESSVPAFADFSKDERTRTVNVSTGEDVAVDFVAQPLGSIAGKLEYAPELGPDHVGPVLNAYVVAEPGEHAAITFDDGTFLIDNLSPGTYTVSVDPETLPDETGPIEGDKTIVVGPNDHEQGIVFTVGHKQKKVVFSFVGGGAGAAAAAVATIDLQYQKLPPYGSTLVTVDAPESAEGVELKAFNRTQTLAYVKKKGWVGTVLVPASAKPGNYPVEANLRVGVSPQPGTIVVDPAVPIANMQVSPPNAKAGDYVGVRARFLTDVAPGDKIEWEDGTTTTLGKAVAGRIFTFSLHLSLRPLHGTLLTRAGRLPIEIL